MPCVALSSCQYAVTVISTRLLFVVLVFACLQILSKAGCIWPWANHALYQTGSWLAARWTALPQWHRQTFLPAAKYVHCTTVYSILVLQLVHKKLTYLAIFILTENNRISLQWYCDFKTELAIKLHKEKPNFSRIAMFCFRFLLLFEVLLKQFHNYPQLGLTLFSC